MNIGQPKREIYVDPIELPEPLREVPAQEPQNVPATPERVPAEKEE